MLLLLHPTAEIRPPELEKLSSAPRRCSLLALWGWAEDGTAASLWSSPG